MPLVWRRLRVEGFYQGRAGGGDLRRRREPAEQRVPLSQRLDGALSPLSGKEAACAVDPGTAIGSFPRGDLGGSP